MSSAVLAVDPIPAPTHKPASKAPPPMSWKVLLWRLLPLSIVLLGLWLRVAQYAADRSLFLDEAFVASNIVRKSLAELARPLLFDQRAPLGWLWAVKASALRFGESDLALRLVPLMAGMLSLIVFPFVARRYVSQAAVLPALALFACSAPQIFYSSDLKQYSTDTLMALLVLWVFAPGAGASPSGRLTLFRGLVGAVALWFSFPVVFVLAAAMSVLVLESAVRRDWRDLWRMTPMLALWTLGAGSIWWLQLRHFAAEPGWKGLWNDAFLPLEPFQFSTYRWLYNKFFDLATHPAGLEFPGIAALSLVVGIVSLWKERRRELALLLLPAILIVAASGPRIYPASGRVVLFLGVPLTLIIAQGLASLWTDSNPRLRWLAVGLGVLLLAHPTLRAGRHLVPDRMYSNPMFPDYQFEQTKPVMSYIRDHWQPGDHVFLYDMSYVAFEHYAPKYGFQRSDYTIGIRAGVAGPKWKDIRADLQKLAGRPRVWVFFTHVWKHNGADERKLCLYFLDEMGQRIDHVDTPLGCDASAYLYDLTSQSK